MVNTLNPNSAATITAICLLAAIIPSVLLIAPLIVGGMVDHLGFSLEQAGYVLAAEQFAMALATFPALLWLHRINWQHVGYFCLILIIIGDVISASTDGYVALLTVRFLTGIVGGSIMILTLATVNMTAEPDRVFGFWVIGQLVLGAAGLAILPNYLSDLGLSAYYLGKAFLCMPLLLTMRHLPTTIARPLTGSDELDLTQLLRLGLAGLVSIFLFYVALSGVWAYLERLATAAGIDFETIGLVLAISSVAGIAGATVASILNTKHGRSVPIIVGFAMLMVSIGMLYGTSTLIFFGAAACIFKFGWTFVLPYMLACITAIDPSGRLITTTNLMIGAGLAAGPALSAYLMHDRVTFVPVLTVGLIAGLASLSCILPLSKRE